MAPRAQSLLLVAAGAVLGALLVGAGLRWFELPGSVIQAAEADVNARASGPVDSGLPTPAAPRALADAPPSAENAAASQRTAVADLGALELGDDLIATLNELRRHGELDQLVLARVVFNALMESGHRQQALELAERYLSQDPGIFVRLAQAFAGADDLVQARALLARAYALAPGGEWVLAQYCQWDLAGVLPYYRAKLDAQPPPGDPNLRLQIAELSVASNELGAARLLIDELLLEDAQNKNALQLLWQLDPSEAERRLRDLQILAGDEGSWDELLLMWMLEQGRPQDALRVLEERQIGGRLPDASAYGAIAQMYLEQGNDSEAVRLWSLALDAEQGDPDSWTAELQQHAPQRLLELLEAHLARDGSNDEFWGALGDSRWRAGSQAAAAQAWSEAARLDPDDEEWSSKLAAVASGVDPMN